MFMDGKKALVLSLSLPLRKLCAFQRNHPCHWVPNTNARCEVEVRVRSSNNLPSYTIPRKAGTTALLISVRCSSTREARSNYDVSDLPYSLNTPFLMRLIGVGFTTRMYQPQMAANNEWKYQRIFADNEFIAAGQMTIPVGGRKPSKSAKDNTYVSIFFSSSYMRLTETTAH